MNRSMPGLPVHHQLPEFSQTHVLGVGDEHKLESRLPGEIAITSDTQMTHPYVRKQRGTKVPLEENERGE